MLVDDHGVGQVQAERIVVGARGFAARPNADVAHDDVGLAGEGNLAAAKADAAGRGLTRDG